MRPSQFYRKPARNAKETARDPGAGSGKRGTPAAFPGLVIANYSAADQGPASGARAQGGAKAATVKLSQARAGNLVSTEKQIQSVKQKRRTIQDAARMGNEVGSQRREYCPVLFSVQLYLGPIYFCLRSRDTNNHQLCRDRTI